ncbi:hypothetical protein [Tessaracoccus caeni]|uniref:hypothetical protein n=1 Tax=Tessaracoccus caeni TaxID=3031239 RepID=UPI0023DBC13D|nr:hypothetical protein [Tessaracoccus caeni]MDF1487237.1 hypothetical protein [Tessaracoccus caeni]
MKALRPLATAALAATLAVSAPLQANAGWRDISITYRKVPGGPNYITVCEDWGRTKCAEDSEQGRLYNGENSKKKFGWVDTDGYEHVSKSYVTQDLARNTCATKPGWVKVPGTWGFDAVVTIYSLKRCENP